MGRHALIIEDDILIALELEALLGELGFDTCDIADSPNDALARARRHPPQLITADYRIFEGTGVDAVQAIFAELGAIPTIFVTANSQEICGQGLVVEKPVLRSAFDKAFRAATACGPT